VASLALSLSLSLLASRMKDSTETYRIVKLTFSLLERADEAVNSTLRYADYSLGTTNENDDDHDDDDIVIANYS